MPAKRQRPSTSDLFNPVSPTPNTVNASQPDKVPDETQMETAIIYAEGSFADTVGQAAGGILKYFERYEVFSIIDSEKAGEAVGDILDGAPDEIPIYRDLGTALAQARRAPGYLIVRGDPAGGLFSEQERRLLLRAMKYGINIVNGGKELLNDDPEFVEASAKFGVVIQDVAG